MVKKIVSQDHKEIAFEETLKGAVKVKYNELIDQQLTRIAAIKEQARIQAKAGKVSKAAKEFIEEQELELDSLFRQASEWARTAYPNDFNDKPYVSHGVVFDNYDFTVWVSKR